MNINFELYFEEQISNQVTYLIRINNFKFSLIYFYRLNERVRSHSN